LRGGGWWFKFLWARAEIGNGLVKGEYYVSYQFKDIE